MLKGNVLHTRALLQGLKEQYSGVFYSYTKQYSISPDVIDLTSTFGTSDKITECNFIVVNGDLYRRESSSLYYIYRVADNDSKWQAMTGWCNNNGSNSAYAYAINNGKLYAFHNSDVMERVGTSTNWTMVSGEQRVIINVSPGELNFDKFAYGIDGGKLYKLQGTTATRVGSLSNWTFIQGSSDTENTEDSGTYGIAGGKLYKIVNTTQTQVGSDTGFTEVRGNTERALALKGDKLYVVRNTKIAEPTDLNFENNGWSEISQSHAIRNGKLYYTYAYITGSDIRSTMIQVGTSDKWQTIGGIGSSWEEWGINNGTVYTVREGYMTKTSLQKCIGIYGRVQNFAVCNVD